MQACPPPIANAAINGKQIQPISRPSASLFFSDVVGFTTISSSLSPDKVSRMLDNLFKRLDRLAYLHGVQKVDVVGDAYIAATNFTEDQAEDHAARLARFAIDAVAAAQAVPGDEEDPGRHGFLQVRVGLHSGAVTGIVGERGALKYTLVGEAVGVASRMESSGAAGRIQCSAAMAGLIGEQAHDVVVRRRHRASDDGEEVDGPTFWVTSLRHGWKRHSSCSELFAITSGLAGLSASPVSATATASFAASRSSSSGGQSPVSPPAGPDCSDSASADDGESAGAVRVPSCGAAADPGSLSPASGRRGLLARSASGRWGGDAEWPPGLPDHADAGCGVRMHSPLRSLRPSHVQSQIWTM